MIEPVLARAIQGKPAVFDTAKLEWMNGQYLSHTGADDLLAPVMRQLERMGVEPRGRDPRTLIDAAKARSRTVLQLAGAGRGAARCESRVVATTKAGEAGEEDGTGVHAATCSPPTPPLPVGFGQRTRPLLEAAQDCWPSAAGPSSATCSSRCASP